MSNFLRPEEKNNPRKRHEGFNDFMALKRYKNPWWRGANFLQHQILADTPLQQQLYKYSHRSNTWKLWLLAAFSMYIGQILYYVNYKIKVQEPKWVEDYGQDIPHFRKFKPVSTIQLIRAKYVHFYRYKLFYFVEEQVVDPLNENSLSANKFDVYQFKRLIRAIKYDQQRDDSFDFMQIGEDDIQDYDDFV